MVKLSKLDDSIDELISEIKNSKEYRQCILLKQQMNDNKELMELINTVKKLQKQYIKSDFSSDIKKQLDLIEEELNQIPIYIIYNDNLKEVNRNIDIMKDYLNDYFNNKMNNNISF